MDENSTLDLISMSIIASAGDGRSLAFQALEKAKEGNFEEADQLIKDANQAIGQAHKAQTDLLVQEANGNRQDVNVLLVHSQDHLMTGMLAIELISEIIKLYKEK